MAQPFALRSLSQALSVAWRQHASAQSRHAFSTMGRAPQPSPLQIPQQELGGSVSLREMMKRPRAWGMLAGLLGMLGVSYGLATGPIVTDKVYLDIEVDGAPLGRVVVGLFGWACPETTRNFVGLASHQEGYGYRGSSFHTLVKNYAVVGGDITKGDGSGGVSIFGPSFPAETQYLKHHRGTVSMVVREEGESKEVRSQFLICCMGAPQLNKKMLAFGKVLQGMEVVDALSALPTSPENNNRPLQRVRIADCGKVN